MHARQHVHTSTPSRGSPVSPSGGSVPAWPGDRRDTQSSCRSWDLRTNAFNGSGGDCQMAAGSERYAHTRHIAQKNAQEDGEVVNLASRNAAAERMQTINVPALRPTRRILE